MVFNIEKLPYGKQFCGVYEMRFDTGHFYFGSSKHLKSRIRSWVTGLSNGNFKNRKINSVLPSVSSVSIKVLQITDTKEDALLKEDALIKEHWGNDMLLNRCPTAKDHTGFEFSYEDDRGKAIAIFDSKWKFIETLPALMQVARKYKFGHHKIYSFLRGNVRDVNGYKFKRVSDTGDFIEPIPYRFEKKGKHCRGTQCDGQCNTPFPNCPGYRNNAGSPPKRVQKYSKEGELLATFGSIGIAAKSINTEKKSFKKQITASPTGFARGYIWKVIG
jgi:hypothetical protein